MNNNKQLSDDMSLENIIADKILQGYNRHFQLFQELTVGAQSRFELGLWHQVHQANRDRTDYYDLRISETIAELENFALTPLDKTLWAKIKIRYTERIKSHPQVELAESFYNSIFCRLFERQYYLNQYIFVETSLNKPTSAPPGSIYKSYHPQALGLLETIEKIIENCGFNVPFKNIQKDVKNLFKEFRSIEGKTYPLSSIQIDILNNTFYRNKGAYIIGRIIHPGGESPFIVCVLNDVDEGLYIDCLLADKEDMAVIFGFARSYFFVNCQYPGALVDFLNRLIPRKSRAELYNAIGFHKQGKTQFYRDFLHHLDDSDDEFVLAEGIKGMVMSVFTLPSYPYVFKVIKDKFAPTKRMTRKDVKAKYRLVKLHDRVGRMADTMEYSEVAFPVARFSAALLEELEKVAPSLIRYENDLVIISHLYIERRMIPLNLYLAKASEEEIDDAMFGYGQAIKQLIAANIFPGDMLLKNFGVTRHGRVIFYDYDEITYMDEVNFRVKPEPVTEEQIYAAEPWYTVEPGDVFPEEIATFALANIKYRKAFIKHHEELLDASYWQRCQQRLKKGIIEDVFPYPEHKRFCNATQNNASKAL